MQKRSIHLVPITHLETDAQLAIRQIRNDPDVRKVMYTDHLIGVNEHLQWISHLKNDTSQIVFGIVDVIGQRPVGVVSLTALDPKNKRSDWAFYLSSEERSHGLGPAIEDRFIEFAFDTVGLEKLGAAVLEGNNQIVRLHKKFGFEVEGFRKSEIDRNGVRVGVHLLGLQKNAWIENQSALRKAYGEVFERFEIEIHWEREGKSLTAIDQIEVARAKNNVNWMNILRIAVEKSPVNAKQIIAEIKELDQRISALTAQIDLEP
jgi:UDP-4-amino-4,6-dideoxy-N-acetyl-beta-L-altrosamine N-acetyltransferase